MSYGYREKPSVSAIIDHKADFTRVRSLRLNETSESVC